MKMVEAGILRKSVGSLTSRWRPAGMYKLMRRTHIYIEEREVEDATTAVAEKFKEAKEEYELKDLDAKYKWRDNLVRKCPHLDQFLTPPQKRRKQ